MVQNVSDGVGKLISGKHDEAQLAILDWLTPFDYAKEHSDIIRRRQPGTGQWFLASPEYQAWRDGDKQVLFFPGIPGAGKTVMISIVIDDLQEQFRKNQSIGIAYIYCSFQRQHEQKAEDLLASLLKQLTHRCSSFPQGVEDLYNRHREERTRPLFDEISKTLLSTATKYSRIFVAVDALDECNDASWEKMLAEIFALQSKVNVSMSIIATSRMNESIKSRFGGFQSLEIYANDEDIQSYVAMRTNHLEKDLLDNDIREKIRKGVTTAAEGMYVFFSVADEQKSTNSCLRFLLVELHMGTLKSQPTKGHIQETLLGLGKGIEGLDTTYEQAMQRIDSQSHNSRALAKRILAWIVHSERPLLAEELQHALAIRPGVLDTKELDTNFLPTRRVLLSLCAGLVTIDEATGIIRLVHFTTQEFFIRRATFSQAHSDITQTCVTYLSLQAFESGFCRTDKEFEGRLLTYKLYHYAAHHWGHHAHKWLALNSVAPLEGILGFLQCKAKVAASGQVLMAKKLGSTHSNYSQEVPGQVTGLHLGAYFGLERVIRVLLDKKVDLNAKDGHGWTLLWWAAQNRHQDMVKLLLKTEKVDVDAKDEDGRTPLSLAAGYGSQAIVKLLLETETVDIDAKDKDDRTPLWWAVRNGDQGIVKLLLETEKADVDVRDRLGETPLSRAARHGHQSIVKLLLETKKVDVEVKDSQGRTPLSWAARRRRQAVVKLLLETAKVNIDVKDRDNRTPLSLAAEYGYQDIVKLLLETEKVDVTLKDRHGRTPLWWAAWKGHQGVVNLLLETEKFDVDTKKIYGRKPFSWAASSGH